MLTLAKKFFYKMDVSAANCSKRWILLKKATVCSRNVHFTKNFLVSVNILTPFFTRFRPGVPQEGSMNVLLRAKDIGRFCTRRLTIRRDKLEQTFVVHLVLRL